MEFVAVCAVRTGLFWDHRCLAMLQLNLKIGISWSLGRFEVRMLCDRLHGILMHSMLLEKKHARVLCKTVSTGSWEWSEWWRHRSVIHSALPESMGLQLQVVARCLLNKHRAATELSPWEVLILVDSCWPIHRISWWHIFCRFLATISEYSQHPCNMFLLIHSIPDF